MFTEQPGGTRGKPLGWNFGYLLPSGKRNKTAPVLPAALEDEAHRAAGEHEGVSPSGSKWGYLLFARSANKR